MVAERILGLLGVGEEEGGGGEGLSVIDIGAGTGAVGEEMRRRGFRGNLEALGE